LGSRQDIFATHSSPILTDTVYIVLGQQNTV
jgi:hypothetical protein